MWTAAKAAARVRRALPGGHRGAVDRRRHPLPAPGRAGCRRGTRRRLAGRIRADPRLQRRSGDRHQRRGSDRLGLPGARGAGPRRRLHRRHGSRRARGNRGRAALPRDPRPDQSRQGRPADVGFKKARHELVAVTDADTHMHPQALKMLVARMCRSRLLAAIAGAPHVTNRGRFLLAMQILEAASIIGLMRRTQSLTGRVGRRRASWPLGRR
jgi:Glycosyl transferase family 21